MKRQTIKGVQAMTTNTDKVRTAITAGLSRRRMLKGSGAALAVLGLAGVAGSSSDATQANAAGAFAVERLTPAKPNIVLVHGAWADGSSWSGVIERLQKAGYTVTA